MGNGATPLRVLLVGPDDEARRALHLLMDRRGLRVAAAPDVETARKHLGAEECDLIVAAAEVAAELARDGRPVVAVAKTREPGSVLPLLEAGVEDVVAEPIDDLAIALAIHRLATRPRPNGHANGHANEKTNGQSNGKPNGKANGTAAAAAASIVGDGAEMTKLKATIRTVAATRTTVLIQGESGTGKELVARAIHDASPRAGNKFVAVNCAAIPAPLLESELFGHVRGSFTDAVRDKTGLFEEADGGTLFLDEVGELPLPLQAKLLRALQESEIRRVGDTQSIKIDVRLVAATLRDLTEDVAAGKFREDLYYRLNVINLQVPPLRERAEDIPQLARFFTARHGARHNRTIDLTDDGLAVLAAQPWPGNVRELENALERAVVLADEPRIDAELLGTLMKVKQPNGGVPADELSIKKATRSLEEDLIRRALGVTGGNRTNAAKLLEISHRALLYKMKEYGIS